LREGGVHTSNRDVLLRDDDRREVVGTRQEDDDVVRHREAESVRDRGTRGVERGAALGRVDAFDTDEDLTSETQSEES